MSKIIDTIIGSLDEKKAYKQNEARAKALPPEYATAYKEIQKYIFSSTGLLSMEPLVALVDLAVAGLLVAGAMAYYGVAPTPRLLRRSTHGPGNSTT